MSEPSSGLERVSLKSDAVGAVTDVLGYLAAHNTVSIATIGADGPWASTVFYVNIKLDLYFLSEPKTQHIQNLAVSPRVAATVNEDYRDWQQIKGVQLAADCVQVSGKVESIRALRAYVKKYPFVRQFLTPGQLLVGMQVAGRALDVRLYRLRPTRVLYLDNQRGFSNRQEIVLESQR